MKGTDQQLVLQKTGAFMLQNVEVKTMSLEDYRPIVGDEVIDEIWAQAESLKGATIVHINATGFGGGVAEILQTLAPLMRDVGLDARWQIIEGADEFFKVTKAMHNGLQGMGLPFSDEMKAIWQRYNELNAKKFEGHYDIVVVHDPQPAGLLHFTAGQNSDHWIWRCHIDTSHPNPDYWGFMAPYLNEYPAAVFTMAQYVGPGVDFKHLATITPTTDPLSAKNAPLDPVTAKAIVTRYGFDPDRPLLVQVSRFDPWKDPLGVIDAYRLVKDKIPEVQLALVGSMASDDPEGWNYYDRTVRHAGEDYDVRILHNFHGVGNEAVNAFQTAADVVIQKSTREGFGLVVTEALWKEKPVIGGKVGGIPLQVIDGQTGFLVESVEECAEKILYLLEKPAEAQKMGLAAREHVRQHFLSPHQLAYYLQLFNQLLTG
jgi:trehalose synthase